MDSSTGTIVPRHLLILNYHRLVATTSDRYAVAPAAFEKQLQLVRELQLPVIGLESLKDTAPSFAVAFTFDDGYTTDIEIARPLLLQYGYTAAFFPVLDFIGKENRLNAEQLRTLATENFTIGSHGISHRDLRSLPKKELLHELQHSRQQLEIITGKTVGLLALPYGRYNDAVMQQVRAAGYRAVLSTDTRMNTISSDTLLLHRWNVRRATSLRQLRALLTGKGSLPTRMALASKAKMLAKKLLNR